MRTSSPKAMILRSETLRNLEANQLREAHGGGFPPLTFTCPPLKGPSSKC